MFIAFPWQQWFSERTSMLSYTYIACLATFRVCFQRVGLRSRGSQVSFPHCPVFHEMRLIGYVL